MREWLLENGELLLSLVTVIVASVASICGVSAKWNSDKKQLQLANTELEADKVRLEQAIIEGSFIICPNCGCKIKLKDATIYTGGKNAG